MPPEMLRGFGLVLGLVVSGPLALACLRAASFFGSFKTTVEQIGENLKALSSTVSDHAERIPVLETEVRHLKGDTSVHIHQRVNDR